MISIQIENLPSKMIKKKKEKKDKRKELWEEEVKLFYMIYKYSDKE